MRWRIIAMVFSLVAAGTLGAVVFAQLGGTQTASGTINVTTTSADLYMCEPDSTPGPGCGSDDSGADETVFETVEDMLPGDTVQWDIRLKNVGTEAWVVTSEPTVYMPVNVAETLDPGADCPDGALGEPFPTSLAVLGKDGDELNDNIPVDMQHLPGASVFLRESLFPSQSNRVYVKVAPGDFEDMRLRLELDVGGTENCGGNEWNVSWEFVVAPVSP